MSEDILIVDDERDIREALQMMLEFEGYNVLLSSDGKIAEELPNCMGRNPKLIILDVMLCDGKDGRDIVRMLKSLKQTKNIPILMISAFQNIRGDVKRAGADDFLPKPFEYDQMLGKVRKYID